MNAITCKLCHGPTIPGLVVHEHCKMFACSGCVAKNRDTYNLLNLKNHIYEYHCAMCMAEEPPSSHATPLNLPRMVGSLLRSH